MYTSLPFGNTLVTKELNGTELRNLLASQAGWNEQYGFETALQVSGVHYEVNVRDEGIPVSDVYVEGEPLAMNETYNVTLNSYMAGWEKLEGQPYSVNVSAQPTVSTNLTLYGTAAVEYIEANSPVAPADANRIRRVTQEAGNATLSATGDGELRTTFDVPDSVQRVNASGVFAQNQSAGTVRPTSVSYDNATGNVTVTFDAEAYREFAAVSGDIQLYAGYETDAFQLVAFDEAVLNVDLGPVPAAPGDEDDRRGPPWADNGEEERGEDDEDGKENGERGPPWADEDDENTDRGPPWADENAGGGPPWAGDGGPPWSSDGNGRF